MNPSNVVEMSSMFRRNLVDLSVRKKGTPKEILFFRLLTEAKEILASIKNKEEFDAHVQHLLFEELIPAWEASDDF